MGIKVLVQIYDPAGGMRKKWTQIDDLTLLVHEKNGAQSVCAN